MAVQVATALKGISLDAAYSSPLNRAKRTAELILSNSDHAPDLQTSEDLREINLPLWEGLLFDEVEEKYPDEYHDWRTQPHLLTMSLSDENGSVDFLPVPAIYEQARQFWQTTLPNHAGQTILIVAHSGINRALINTAIGLQPGDYQRFRISNCGISILNFSGEYGQPVQIESLNITSHVGEPLPRRRSKNRGLRLLLVRHGETEWNRQGRFQGQIDVPLNENGRSQAAQAGEFLKSVPIDQAISSSMLRPKETAEVILQHHPDLELDLRDDLREISHGLWAGKLEAEIEQSYPGLLHQWQQHPETVQMPEGEDLQAVWSRAIAGWQAMINAAAARSADEPYTILVVAHDAINKAILCHVAGLGAESFWNFKQGNGAVSVIDYPQGIEAAPLMQAMNITTHLGGVLDKTAAGAL